MHRRILLAIALAIAVPGVALAASGPKVTVRVEGKTHNLLPATVVQTHSGWITKGGVATGMCSATSGAGALDVATHHNWGGTFSTSFSDYFVTNILGETESGKIVFWGVFLNNKTAQTGVCGMKLHTGDQLLFAAIPAKGTTYPTALTAPSSVTTGHSFTVKMVFFNAKGAAKPLAGARVSGGGLSAVTGKRGTASITATHAGSLMLNASEKGYIRAAAVRVHVSG